MRDVRSQESFIRKAVGRQPLAVSRKLLVRPVTMADKPAVLRVSSRIWQGNDYVPLFFDRWVRDGGFWAGEVRGRLVGYGKATQLSPGEWWLEGLRVDPAWRKRGIGKELSRQVLLRTLDRRPVSLRLATADVNHESIHIIETVMGFKPFTQYKFFTGTPRKTGTVPRVLAPGTDARRGPCDAPCACPLSGTVPVFRSYHKGRILEFKGSSVRHSNPRILDSLTPLAASELSASKGLLQYTWLFRNFDRRYMTELKRGGYVYGYRVGEKLAGVMVLRPHRYHAQDLDISFIAGGSKVLAAFRDFISLIAHERGTENISGMAASKEMGSAFRSLGLKPHPRIGSVLVFEYPV